MFPLLGAIFALPFVGYIFSGIFGGLIAGIAVTFFMKQILTIIFLVLFVLATFTYIKKLPELKKSQHLAYIVLIFAFLSMPFLMNVGIFKFAGIASYAPILPYEQLSGTGSLANGQPVSQTVDIGMLIVIVAILYFTSTKSGKNILKKRLSIG